jgi:hypothetical protein
MINEIGDGFMAQAALKTTTVRLPRRLYEEARRVVEKRATDANSFNDLLIESLESRLKQLRRERIDAEFASMKNDVQYQKQANLLMQEFDSNDRETIRTAESKP